MTRKSHVAARKKLLEHLKRRHTAILSTVDHSGAPHATPITYIVTDDFTLAFITRDTSRKVAHIRHEPRVSVCILDDGIEQSSVQMHGKVTSIAPASQDDIFPFIDALWQTPPFLPNFLSIPGGNLVKIEITLENADMFFRQSMQTASSSATIQLLPQTQTVRSRN